MRLSVVGYKIIHLYLVLFMKENTFALTQQLLQ